MPTPKEIVQQLKDLWQNLSREQKIASLGILSVVLASFLVLIYYTNRVEWGLLYRGLPEENLSQVVDFLKKEKIPYKLKGERAIYVPKDKVPEIRMTLASKGIIGPHVEGFEIFDRNQLGATDFLQRVNYQRALEGELSRTISSLKEVESARVHLALPKESLFISQEKPPKAAVFIKLKPGMTLSRSEVQGIVNLVSSAVTGLDPENVSVVDTTGHVLYHAPSPEEQLNNEQLAYKQHLEEAYKEKIEQLLSQALGPGHAIAQVTVDVDFTKETVKEEIYDPEGTAIRSELSQEEQKEGGTNSGVPGVKGALANKVEGNTKTLSRTEKEYKRSLTRNYEVSKVSRNKELEPGSIKRISVAVLLDSSILGKHPPQKGEAQASEDTSILVERLVKGAIGYNPDRGDRVEVVSLPFEGEASLAQESKWYTYASRFTRPVLEFLLILLFLLLIVRPILKTFLERLAPAEEPLEEALPTGEEAELEGEEIQPLPQEIALGIIQSRPERAAILVKKWLAEESEEERKKIIKEAEENASV